MAFNGAGQFNRIYNWTADAANAIPILASRMDAEDSGFATGLSNCICKDGQTTITADIPFANHKITGLADATATQDAMNQRASDARYQALSITAKKASPTPRTSTTLSADPDLSIPLVAGLYQITALLSFNGSTTGTQGIKFSFAFSGGLGGSHPNGIPCTAIGNVNSTGVSSIFGAGSTQTYSTITTSVSGFDCIGIRGTINVASSGNLVIYWAQNSSSANASNLLADCMLKAEKIP